MKLKNYIYIKKQLIKYFCISDYDNQYSIINLYLNKTK